PVRIGGEELGGGEGQEVRYGKKYAWLEREVNERLRRTARENWLTVNTMVQGALGVVLGRYSGREDAVFGATVSGRGGEVRGVEGVEGDAGGQTNYPVEVLGVGGERLRLQINYEESYSAGQMERMLEQMRVILEGMAEGGRRVGELPRMSAQEERQVMVEWNG